MKLRRRIKLALKGLRHPGDIRRLLQNRRLARINTDELAASLQSSGAIHPDSVLFVTIDSCRFDVWQAANCPTLKSIGEPFEAEAPATFTLASHAAMFVGITPGIAGSREPYRNPKAGRIFRLVNGAAGGVRTDWIQLRGGTIVEGFKRRGFHTIGTGAMRWFDPSLDTGRLLTDDFDVFSYTGRDAEAQVAFALAELDKARGKPCFVFINIGETHIPYHYKGAPWPPVNHTMPFGKQNSRDKSQQRQRACLEFVDGALAPIIQGFQHADASIVCCADHGDCHGEDGLWGHGFYHEMVMKVPMVYDLKVRDEHDTLDASNEGIGVPEEMLEGIQADERAADQRAKRNGDAGEFDDDADEIDTPSVVVTKRNRQDTASGDQATTSRRSE
ncbi:MAG: sulfatase-like hydrolase/transferase [Phycisphaerales bacterium]